MKDLDIKKIKKAREYATKMHDGQTRKGGEPYITHPENVAERLYNSGFNADFVITALFHDLLEDTTADEKTIISLGGEKVLTAVRLLTKNKKNYNPLEYISAIKSNEIAFAVKAEDRLHNLTCALTCDQAFRRKYAKESIDYYLDFSNEIVYAAKRLTDSLDEPLEPAYNRKLQKQLDKIEREKK